MKKSPQKKQTEKPTPEQLKKLKKNPKPEKKAPFPFPPEKEDSSTGSPTEDVEEEEIFTKDSLKEICKGLAVTVVLICKVFDKEIEQLDEAEKNMLAEPMANCALKWQIQKWMKDEFALALAVAVIISKRIRIKKKVDKKPEEVESK